MADSELIWIPDDIDDPVPPPSPPTAPSPPSRVANLNPASPVSSRPSSRNPGLDGQARLSGSGTLFLGFSVHQTEVLALLTVALAFLIISVAVAWYYCGQDIVAAETEIVSSNSRKIKSLGTNDDYCLQAMDPPLKIKRSESDNTAGDAHRRVTSLNAGVESMMPISPKSKELRNRLNRQNLK